MLIIYYVATYQFATGTKGAIAIHLSCSKFWMDRFYIITEYYIYIR